jgi:hypothetical protein
MNYIRDSVCLIICANFLGDLYYPYHVGAIYFTIDFFTVPLDRKIHHIFALMAIYANSYVPESQIIKPLIINTEISTIFLTIVPYYNISVLPFVLTFFKYRIYDFCVYLPMYTTLLKNNIILGTGVYGLFALNLYWLALICKKLTKPWFKNKRSEIICQEIVSYTYFVNVGISLYMYRTINWDVIGIILLSVSSYIYHQKVITIDNPVYIMPYSYVDTACIHIRSILAFNQKLPRLVYHVIAYYYRMAYTDYNHIEKYFVLSGLCYFVDIALALYSHNCYMCVLEMLFVTYILLLVHYTNPFYEMSYVAYHIAFMYKTYLICKINIGMIE